MPYYQHRFNDVQGYLHHRPPYLLVDRVATLETESVVTEAQLRDDAFFFPGHFPGAPIFPGALMQELTTQSAGILIAANYNPMPEYDTSDPAFNRYALGVLVRVRQARYRGFARPGDLLRVHVRLTAVADPLFEFQARLTAGQRTLMTNSFQLANIDSRRLTSD